MNERTRNELRRLAPEVDTAAGLAALIASHRRQQHRNRALGAGLAVTALVGLAAGVTRLGDRDGGEYIIAGDATPVPATPAPVTPGVTIDSDVSPPQYPFFDAGPLSPRLGASLVWTGAEMIVSGGFVRSPSDRYEFVDDGAAFDPLTDTWRPISDQPSTTMTSAKSFWTGEHMLVIGADGGLSYDPQNDAWSRLAALPFALPDLVRDNLTFEAVWSGEALFVWRPDTEEMAAYDPRTGQWTEMPGPELGATHPATLLADQNRLVALGTGWPSGPSAVSWDVYAADWIDGQWRHADPVTFVTDNHSNVADVDEAALLDSAVVVWGDYSEDPGPTWILDANGEWSEAPPMPIATGTVQAGSVVLDGRVMALSEGLHVALFSPETRTWTKAEFPELLAGPSGWSGAQPGVWTGTELLVWASGAAWRWTPPEPD